MKDLLNKIENIDGIEIIEQYLLFHGEQQFAGNAFIKFKELENMALIHFGLPVTGTNRLYIGNYLMRFYNKAGLVNLNGKIKIPLEIYEKVRSINEKYRKGH